MKGKKPHNDFGELAVLGEHCSDRERRSEAAERELVKVKLLDYLSSRIGLELDAVVTGVEEFGLFVQGIELPAEGLVHVSSLSDDFYRFDRASHTLSGYRSGNRFRLGDSVRVTVARVDVDRRELDLRDRGPRHRPPPARDAVQKRARGQTATVRSQSHEEVAHPKQRQTETPQVKRRFKTAEGLSPSPSPRQFETSTQLAPSCATAALSSAPREVR